MEEARYTMFALLPLLNTPYSYFSASHLSHEVFALPSYSVAAHPSDIRICYLAWHLLHQHYWDIVEPFGATSPCHVLYSLCKKVIGECS